MIDFDKVVRDWGAPTRLLKLNDSGDNLHPSEAGYKARADAFDLNLFKNGKAVRRDQKQAATVAT